MPRRDPLDVERHIRDPDIDVGDPHGGGWQVDKKIPVTWLAALVVHLVLTGAFGQHVLDRVDSTADAVKAMAASVQSKEAAAADTKITGGAMDVLRERAATHDRQLLDLEVRMRELEQRRH